MAANQFLTKKVYLTRILLLLFFTAVSIITSLLIGSVTISFIEVVKVLFGVPVDEMTKQIILEIRMPRVLLAVAVGGGLSVAGAVFQAILRNPLAEPYILGISSGGTFGAVLSMLLGFAFLGTQVLAFAGALMVVFLVFMLGKRFGELEPHTLLLSGVMIGAFFSALILIMITMLNESLRTAIFWLIGNLSLAKSESVYFVLPLSFIISLVLIFNSQKYNVLSLGTEHAKQLGINTGFVKNLTYILASFLIGSLVSVSGIIGFVGLLVPHVCRMMFGVDNRIIIPASFLIGAGYLSLADSIARIIISPAELPVGAVTAIIGAPVFIYLLRRRFAILP